MSKIKKVLKPVTKIIKPIASFAAPLAGLALGPAGLGVVGALGGAGIGAGIGALSGNGLKGIASGALGGFGGAGGAGALGNYLSGTGGLGLSSGAAGALGGALLGAGSGALVGGGLKGAALGAGLGGAGGYIQGSGGFGKAYDNIKSGLGLQGAGVGTLGSGTNTAAAGITGGGNSSYSSVIKNPDAGFGFTSPVTGGISTSTPATTALTGAVSTSQAAASDIAKAAASPSIFSKIIDNGALISPLASAGLSTYSNQAAADSLIEQQNKNLASIQPYLNQSFNPSDLENDPGYQFQLGEGTKAIDRAASARGNYFSGQALTDAAKYGQGLADSTYNDAYSRWLNGRNSNISALLNANGYNDAIGNVNANAITNTSNGLAGAGAALLGQNGIGNNGQSLNPGYGGLTNEQLLSLLQQQRGLR